MKTWTLGMIIGGTLVLAAGSAWADRASDKAQAREENRVILNFDRKEAIFPDGTIVDASTAGKRNYPADEQTESTDNQ